MGIGSFIFGTALVFCIISGLLVLTGVIFALLYCVKGQQWMDENVFKKDKKGTESEALN